MTKLARSANRGGPARLLGSAFVASLLLVAMSMPGLAQSRGGNSAGEAGSAGETPRNETLSPAASEILENDPLGDPLADRGDLRGQEENPLEGSGEAAQRAIDSATAIEAGMVEVSLGDWKLKNEIADVLGVSVSAIPLTVNVSSELASEVCPIDNNTLDQQGALAALRTCAAKSMTEDLVTAVKEQRPQPSE